MVEDDSYSIQLVIIVLALGTRNLLAWKVGHDDKNFQLPPLLVISTNQMQAKSIFCGSGITKDHGGGYSTTDYSTVSSQKHCQDSTFLSLGRV